MRETPISITLHYFALLREERGATQELRFTNSATAAELYTELSQHYPFTLPADRIGVAINDSFSSIDALLSDGDKVTFIPPVAGG
jgi:molybdopterin converting factor small subunit